MNNTGEKDSIKKEIYGPYKVICKVGEGGFGIVYRAKDTTLDREVAVKVMCIKRNTSQEAQDNKSNTPVSTPELKKKEKAFEERFIKEAQNAAKLDHPNIAKVYYAGVDGNHRFFAMEYIDGKGIDDLLEQEGPLSVPLTLHIIYFAVSALAEALKYGIIHRDIKPSNIMLTDDYTVKIVDFGLSKILSENSSITADGTAFGTPFFMSPEQCKGDPLDFRSDIYSLGITMFYMLTHKYPFEADKPLAILNKHVNEDLPDVCLFARDTVTQDVKNLLTRMTNKNPDDRYQSYVVLLSELRKLRLRYPFINDRIEEEITVNDSSSSIYGADKSAEDIIEEHKTMKERFKFLIMEGDIFEIEDFLIRYPESEYTKLLEEKLAHLRDEAEIFKKAEMLDVYEEWEKFIKLFPEGKYSNYASERLEYLHEIREKESDRKAQKLELFERAKKRNNRDDYEQFLLLYPNSEESITVRSLLDRWEQSASIPPEQKTVEKSSHSFSRLIEKSEKLIEQKDYADALDIVNNILSKNPKHARAQVLREKILKTKPSLSPYFRSNKAKIRRTILYIFIFLLFGIIVISDLFIYRSILPVIMPEITKNYAYLNTYYSLKPVLKTIFSSEKIAGADKNADRLQKIVNTRRNVLDAIEQNKFFDPPGDNFIEYLDKLAEIDDNRKYYQKLKFRGIDRMLEIGGYYDSLMKYEESKIIYDHILSIDPDNSEVRKRFRIRDYNR